MQSGNDEGVERTESKFETLEHAIDSAVKIDQPGLSRHFSRVTANRSSDKSWSKRGVAVLREARVLAGRVARRTQTSSVK